MSRLLAVQSDASALDEDEAAALEEERRITTGFFLLGAASDITFNGIVLSVAYLVQELGKDVLGVIGFAQFLGSLCAMLFLFALALRHPGGLVQEVSSQCRYLALALAYLLLINLAMLSLVSSGWHLRSVPLQVALFVNGIATGSSQSLVGVLSGYMTKFGGQPTAASAQMSGVGFGIALPTAAQALFLPLGVDSRTAAGISYGLAVLVTVCGMAALWCLRGTESFKSCERGTQEEVARRDTLAAALDERFSWWAVRRLQQVALPSLGLLANFAAMVYCNLMSPRFPASGPEPPPEELPTLLLGVTNVCDFLGRLLALQLVKQSRASGTEGGLLRLPLLSVLLVLRLVVAATCLAYRLWALRHLDRLADIHSNMLVVGIYAAGSTVGGTVTVGLTQYAQSICMRTSGPNMDQTVALPCPLAGQIMFLACIIGSVLGTVLPPN